MQRYNVRSHKNFFHTYVFNTIFFFQLCIFVQITGNYFCSQCQKLLRHQLSNASCPHNADCGTCDFYALQSINGPVLIFNHLISPCDFFCQRHCHSNSIFCYCIASITVNVENFDAFTFGVFHIYKIPYSSSDEL